MNMLRVYILSSFLFSCGLAHAGEVSVFTVAHADDWQLFMNPAAFHATQGATNKAVFIIATAGDSGERREGKNGLVPYHKVRETAALRAVHFMVDAQDSGVAPQETHTTVKMNGHELERYVYSNCVTYFLRLPDGSADGGGFRRNRFASLKNFYFKNINIMNTVDGRTAYRGWEDLTSTLSAIVAFEAAEADSVRLHVFDTDEGINPGEHSDHRCISLAMQDAAEARPAAALVLHSGYSTGDKKVNVHGMDYQIDVGAWAVTASCISDAGYPSPWGPEHNAWLGKNYYRIEDE